MTDHKFTEGTYRLTADIPAVVPDRRKRHDWRARPVEAGSLFIVERAYGSNLLGVRLCGAGLREAVLLDEFPGTLEPVVETPSQWLRREHGTINLAGSILDHLVASGRLSMADVQAASEAVLNSYD